MFRGARRYRRRQKRADHRSARENKRRRRRLVRRANFAARPERQPCGALRSRRWLVNGDVTTRAGRRFLKHARHSFAGCDNKRRWRFMWPRDGGDDARRSQPVNGEGCSNAGGWEASNPRSAGDVFTPLRRGFHKLLKNVKKRKI